MTDNNEAVEAGAEVIRREHMGPNWGAPGQWQTLGDRAKDKWRGKFLPALRAALPHLTADDLRNTPAGRVLLAEGWDQGVADNDRSWKHVYDGHDVDPDDLWAMCQTCVLTNPYREETE